MNLPRRYEIESKLNTADFSSLILRVTLYDRSLKPTILHFIASENLQIQSTILADAYVDYEIACEHDQCVRRLEQMLKNATLT